MSAATTVYDPIESHIKHYFRYVRLRLENLELLFNQDQGRFQAERWIVLSAVVESVAKRWADLQQPAGLNGAQVTGGFLRAHASNDIFGRCSRPALLRRAAKDYIALVGPLEAAFPFQGMSSLVIGWREDPRFEDVVRHAGLLPVARGVAWKKDMTWERWVGQSRYGEMLHAFMRNAWLHTLGQHPELLTTDDDGAPLDDPPDYQNLIRLLKDADAKTFEHEDRQELRLPNADPDKDSPAFYTRKTLRVRFMYLHKVVAAAIDSFEAECRARRFDPVPPDWRR